MSINHSVSFVCDNCGGNYMIDEKTMEIPPNWMAVQLAVANEEGYIPEHERDNFLHFCSRECFMTYLESGDFQERIFNADRNMNPAEDETDYPPDPEEDEET